MAVYLSFCCNIKVSASEYYPVKIEIPVTSIKADEGYEQIHEIILESEEAADVGKMQLRLKGSETGRFVFSVNEPGTYVYKVYEEQGSNKKVIYDTRVYHVTIFVVNNVERGLSYSVSAELGDRQRKPEKLEFRDRISSDTAISLISSAESEASAEKEKSSMTLNNVIEIMRTGDYTTVLLPAVLVIIPGIILIIRIFRKRLCREKGYKQYDKK